MIKDLLFGFYKGCPLVVLSILILPGATKLVAVEKRTLIYGETTRLSTFDPYTVHEASGQRLGDLLFDSLVEISEGGRYTAGLAKDWKIENGGTSVLFKLKKNVFWHKRVQDKEWVKFTANDVFTTLRLLLAKKSQIPNQNRFDAIASSEILSPYLIRITLNRAMVDPLKPMVFKILPSHILGSNRELQRNNPFTTHPIGTGPYQFVRANKNLEILLRKNRRYYGKKPQIPQIVMKTYSDQSVMAQSLMFNAIDLITYVSPKDLAELSGDRNINLIPYDALSFSFIAINTNRGILRDKRVRKAISYSINRKEMLKAFFHEKGVLISGPFPPTSWAYNIDVKPIEFNQKRAKQLLNEAGVLKGDGKVKEGNKLLFLVPLSGKSEMIKRIVLAIQGYLGAVGLSIELRFMDWLVWKRKVLRDHEYDLTLASWSFDDASNITSLFHSKNTKAWDNNFVQYRNTKVDSMLTYAAVTNDFDKRRAIYHKLHSVLADDVPYVYLWTLVHHAAHNVKVSGIRIEPFSFFKYIGKWRIRDKLGRDSK